MLFDAVKELRANGELDEEKWRKVRTAIQVFVGIAFAGFLFYFYQFFTIYIETKSEYMDFFGWKAKKEFVWLVFLAGLIVFSYPIIWMTYIYYRSYFIKYLLLLKGKEVEGEVDFSGIREASYPLKYSTIDYYFYNDKGVKYFRFNADANFPSFCIPEKGDKVNILYMEESPNLSSIISDKDKQKYNLRKNKL